MCFDPCAKPNHPSLFPFKIFLRKLKVSRVFKLLKEEEEEEEVNLIASSNKLQLLEKPEKEVKLR